jgi:hypothetical protein
MSEKYQREIENILGQIESPAQRKARSRKTGLFRMMLNVFGRFLGGKGWNLSPGRIMLGSVSILLVALLFGSGMPGILGAALAWGAVILFILGYALFFINPSSAYEKRWRGQSIETPPTLWEQVIRRIKGG